MADYDGNREKLKPAKISANLQAAIDRIEEALVDWVMTNVQTKSVDSKRRRLNRNLCPLI